MSPKELSAHKSASKRLAAVPVFHKSSSGNKLPKPFDKMRSSRLYASGQIDVSDTHRAFFFWRDGALLSDSAFFAWLMCELADGKLSPILEFHYHPSHKGLHAKLPCKTELDYTQRQLPHAPELALKTPAGIDPRTDTGRKQLISSFCNTFGVALGQEGGLWN
jgi:hypothetical protein